MPPRFDRDVPNSMPHMPNGSMGGSSGANMMMNGGGGSNGAINSVSSALRKPLLEINDGKSQVPGSGVGVGANGLDTNGGLMSVNRLDSRGNPIMSANGQVQVHQQQMQQQMPYSAGGQQKGYGRFIDQQQQDRHDAQERNQQQQVDDGTPDDYFISELYQQLSQVINSKPTDVEPLRSGSLHKYLLLLIKLHINYNLFIFTIHFLNNRRR
jgi:hypothetical protein